MKSINIVECKNEDDLKEVAILAEKIWHEFFPGIISESQINYMVDKFQSFDAMQEQVKHQQYHYHKVYDGDELIGYIVFVVCNLLRRRNERKKRKEKR